MSKNALTKNEVGEYLTEIREKSLLGSADDKRISVAEQTIQSDALIPMDIVLKRLFPEKEASSAQADLRAFRKRLNDTLKEAKIDFKLCIDSNKKADITNRSLWFEGKRLTELNLARTMLPATAEINGYRSEEFIQAGAILPDDKTDKPVVKVFISYAHDDKTLKEKFFRLIRTRLKTSRHFNFNFSSDRDIIIGSKGWHTEIQEMIQACDFGLLLLSSNFLVSDYITKEELPRLLDKCLPVALNIIDFQNQELFGIESIQIYTYEKKAFKECSGPNCDRFIQNLALQIEERVRTKEKYPEVLSLSSSSGLKVTQPYFYPSDNMRKFVYKSMDNQNDYYRDCEYTNPYARRSLLAGNLNELHGDKVKVLDHLHDWTLYSDKPYFALLGDFGTGKTFSCRMLAREINRKHENDPDKYPACIYIDLRFISGKKTGSLTDILNDAIEKTRDPLEKSIITAEDIIKMVRENRAMIIYDGLDEKTVHFTPAESTDFVRELMKIRLVGHSQNELPQGKILISCRTHYFRDVFEQNSLFLERDRAGKIAKDYESCILLPFDDSQIREYLQKRLKPAQNELENLVSLINGIHNLREIAQRPYTLSLICEFIPDIEKLRDENKPVNISTLYEIMAESWLGRDNGKHEFSVNHKKSLMKALALEMHNRSEKTIKTDELEDWLDDWLAKNPSVMHAYSNISRETLKKDLRTATFIIREHEKDFTFAHTSLQEYFLAEWIADSLAQPSINTDKLGISMPSSETFDFVVGRLGLDPSRLNKCIKNIELIMENNYVKNASEICLTIWQKLSDRSLPVPQPKAVKLDGANLTDWKIKNLSLSNAIFDGAILRNTEFTNATMQSASFIDADMRSSEFINCTMSRAKLTGALAAGSIWKNSMLSGSTWDQTDLRLANFVGCTMEGVESLNIMQETSIVSCKGLKNDIRPSSYHLGMFTGHSGSISSCTMSADCKKALSGSNDNTLKLWDLDIGGCILTMAGHNSPIHSCAISVDCKRAMSGSWDKTLKLWNLETGECIITMIGHDDVVSSCAMSHDRRTAISGSSDRTLKLWDLETGACIMTMLGHTDSINSCAMSADGKKALSGSSDYSLKLWNLETGECILTMIEHTGIISSCAMSTDCKRAISGSWDKTLKLWDLETGACIMTIQGRTNINSCAMSADGKKALCAPSYNSLNLWDLETGACILTTTKNIRFIHSLAMSADGKKALSGSSDNSLKLWDLETGICILTMPGHSISINSCSLSEDGKKATYDSFHRDFKIWDLETGAFFLIPTAPDYLNYYSSISPDFKRILSGSWDNTLKLCNLETGACFVMTGHNDSISCCVMSADYKRAISGSFDKTLKFWDLEKGECILTMSGHDDAISSCALSDDNRTAISGSWDSTLKLWNLETGGCIMTMTGHDAIIASCAMSTNGKRAISGSYDTTCMLWNLETGLCLLTLRGHTDPILSCAISANSKIALSGSSDSTLKLWDLETGSCILTMNGHTDSVTSCSITSDGKRAVSGSGDNTLKLWNLETGECLMTMANLPNNETACWDGKAQKLLSASPGAWRWIGVSSGARRFPIEILETI